MDKFLKGFSLMMPKRRNEVIADWQPPLGTHGCTAFIITKTGSEVA